MQIIAPLFFTPSFYKAEDKRKKNDSMPKSIFRKTYPQILDIIRVQKLVWFLQKV